MAQSSAIKACGQPRWLGGAAFGGSLTHPADEPGRPIALDLAASCPTCATGPRASWWPVSPGGATPRLPHRSTLARGRLEAGVGSSRREAERGAARTRGPVARQTGLGSEAVYIGPKTPAGRNGDRVILVEARAPPLLSSACTGRTSRTPGSRVLLGGSWPSWAPDQTREPTPSPSGSAGPCPVSGSGSSSASDNLATVEGLLADGPCGVGPLLKRLLLGKSGPEPLARLASNWAVKAMPKNSAIPVRLAHSNRAMTPVSGP